MKHQQKLDIKTNGFLIYAYRNCIYVDILTEYIGFLDCVHYGVWTKLVDVVWSLKNKSLYGGCSLIHT